MAARYVGSIREVCPRGPYLLGGYSLGGIVAYEMARRLAAEGEEIGLVALLDSGAPVLVDRALGAAEDAVLFAVMAMELSGGEGSIDDFVRRLRPLGEDEQIGLVVEQLQHGPPPAAFRVVFFAARERQTISGLDDGIAAEDPTLGWSDLLGDRLALVTIPGSHASMIVEPHVEVLARELDRRLDLHDGETEP
jgi:thioesterase domain-containing protein